MQGNSTLFNSHPEPHESRNPACVVSELSEHDKLIFDYLVNDQQMNREAALQKIIDNDPDVIELRVIESPKQHPLRK